MPWSNSGGGGSAAGVSSYNSRTGVVTAQAGDVEALFTAAGQIFQGTGSGTGALVLPPGYQIGYDQITATVNVTSTTEASGTTIIGGSAYTFDGGLIMAEFFTPWAIAPSVAGGLVVSLFEGSTEIAKIGELSGSGTQPATAFCARYPFTPSAGSHTYTVTAFVSSTSGTPRISAGAGGTATFSPAFLRLTKV